MELYSKRLQKRRKCSKNITDTLSCASCTTFLFLLHFDIICGILLNRCTATWNLFIRRRLPIMRSKTVYFKKNIYLICKCNPLLHFCNIFLWMESVCIHIRARQLSKKIINFMKELKEYPDSPRKSLLISTNQFSSAIICYIFYILVSLKPFNP